MLLTATPHQGTIVNFHTTHGVPELKCRNAGGTQIAKEMGMMSANIRT
jgi:hypothetical protein